ncbi:hypothetical protein F4777DRAFT_539858 [Nemania sp. FL0916]|nr:hypothetical protein F4777DRAFT_539858 [Nemania sp. FL0916]
MPHNIFTIWDDSAMFCPLHPISPSRCRPRTFSRMSRQSSCDGRATSGPYLLVQSRGLVVASCEAGTPFVTCCRVSGFQGSACGACVWRSHGARCSNRG